MAMSHPFNLPPIIAVDFDGTLVKDRFPDIGEANTAMFKAVRRAQAEGYKIILWTCRNGEALKEAVQYCANRGLHFDAINENIDEVKYLYGGDTRKVYADLYLDDKSCTLTEKYGFCKLPSLEVDYGS